MTAKKAASTPAAQPAQPPLAPTKKPDDPAAVSLAKMEADLKAELPSNGGAATAGLMNATVGLIDAAGFALAQRVAACYSRSILVPKDFQGERGLANCVVALNMAARLGADPLMVMQNLYVVYGRPGWSAQFLIATFNQTPGFSALRYEFVGTEGKDDWGCRASAIEISTGEKLTGALVTIGLAKAEGWYNRKSKDGGAASKWPTMPEQMLMYRAATWFVRAYAPEIAMGLQTADELREISSGDSAAATGGQTGRPALRELTGASGALPPGVDEAQNKARADMAADVAAQRDTVAAASAK